MSKFFKRLVEPLIDAGGGQLLEATIDGLLGQVASGLVSFKLSYKQKRFEENTKLALVALYQRQQRIEARLDSLPADCVDFVANTAFPLTFDYVIDESESEKIELLINGFESVIENKIKNQSIILTYNDVLKELRFDEIKELLRFDHRNPDSKLDMSELKELFSSLDDNSSEARTVRLQRKGYKSYVYKKLERLHLIETVTIEDKGNYTESKGEVRLTDFGRNLVDHFKIRYSK